VSSRPVTSDSAVESSLRAALGEPGAPEVASAYLFGSVAEGRAHRESDVDIGVLFAWRMHPTAADRFGAGVRLSGAVQAILGRTVDLVVLNDAPPLLGRHAVTCGRRILCHDERADHAYVRDVQLLAADLAPWLRRMRELELRVIPGMSPIVERLAKLRRHLDHLRALRPRVSREALARDLSLHNDALFSLLTVCQVVIDVAGEIAARRGDRFEDYTQAVRHLARDPRFPAAVVRELEWLPGFSNRARAAALARRDDGARARTSSAFPQQRPRFFSLGPVDFRVLFV